ILIATGSEVQIAVAARERLAAEGIGARVVSMPCVEWFTAQDASYQEEVLPPRVRARVCVEAGVAPGWRGVARARGADGRPRCLRLLPSPLPELRVHRGEGGGRGAVEPGEGGNGYGCGTHAGPVRS